jgi:hypothetical protein
MVLEIIDKFLICSPSRDPDTASPALYFMNFDDDRTWAGFLSLKCARLLCQGRDKGI